PLCKAAVANYESIFGKAPKVDRWNFSTNAVSTMGLMGVPSIGFGPANEIYAHTVEDQVPVGHLVKAAAYYATFPITYLETTK
ncbi:MAG: YgeY family selenium metabolism-linked hydrolase, partial [Bacteriovoracia bacterium]